MPKSRSACADAFASLHTIFPSAPMPEFSPNISFQQLLEATISRLPMPHQHGLHSSILQMKNVCQEQEYRIQRSFLDMDQQVVSLSNINPSLPSGSFAPIDECYFDQNSTLAPQKSFDGSCEYGQAKYIEYIDEVWWSMDNKRAEHEECVSISWIDP